ncbi:MAG: carboxylating nicotinate-nucleotide diphosphorylase [Thermoleophilia bacterium]|nr:carboxylating nicotinate-nucleotide diphosphorylase [Thermoleophilia bacterium]
MGSRGARPHARPGLSLDDIVAAALAEDLGERGDITSELLLPPDLAATAQLRSRAAGVFAGRAPAQKVCDRLGLSAQWHRRDGEPIVAGAVVADISGPARALLTGERTILNFAGRLSGIASLTARFVASAGEVAILDTRKTTPGWRALEKAAVAAGGGTNHRLGLDDQVLVKDNHLALAGASLDEAITAARRRYPDAIVEVEADDLDAVRAGLRAGADWILLDNMSDAQLREAVAVVGGAAKLEASGGMSLERIPDVAATGVDAISVGALTHSATALDLGFDIDA